MLITGANIDKAFIGFDTSFQQALMNQPTVWEKFASRRTSDTESETYMWADLIPELRKWDGEREVVNLAGRSQTLTNDEFERTIGIPRKKFEDDKYGVFTDQVRQLAVRAAQLPDKLVNDALLAGDTAVVYDNQHFFDTAHPQDPDNPSSPTQANKFTGRPLTADNVAFGMAQMSKLKDAGGVPLMVVADTIIVPPALAYLARQICNAAIIALPIGTAGTSPGGAAGQSNVLQGLLEVVVDPRLTSDTTWYLADTKKVVKPLIYQVRIEAEFTYLNRPDDAEVFKRSQFLFGARVRGAAGYGPWFLMAEFTA